MCKTVELDLDTETIVGISDMVRLRLQTIIADECSLAIYSKCNTECLISVAKAAGDALINSVIRDVIQLVIDEASESEA